MTYLSIEVVKLQARKVGGKGIQYLVTVPKDFVDRLGWDKGDKLVARIMELEINGAKRAVLIYYKP